MSIDQPDDSLIMCCPGDLLLRECDDVNMIMCLLIESMCYTLMISSQQQIMYASCWPEAARVKKILGEIHERNIRSVRSSEA